MKKLHKLVEKIKKYIDNNKRYRIYLYLRSQCIKKVHMRAIDEMPDTYIINVYNKKHLLGTNRKVKLVVKPLKLKYSDDKKRELHIEVGLYEGVVM